MVIEGCAFRTERLSVTDWHLGTDAVGLAAVVVTMLTRAVTDSLPPSWQGPYDSARAERWIAERDAEATTLLAWELDTGSPVGLVLLHEEVATGLPGVEIRLGYLLAEDAWGRGLGGELVAGLVRWCRSQPTVSAIMGGVAQGNAASIRILERSGFALVEEDGDPRDEVEYRLAFPR